MLSRRRFLTATLASAVGGLLAACGAAIRSVLPSPTPGRSPAAQTSTPSPSAVPSPSPTGVPLRDRIGQMLLVGFRGRTADEADATIATVASASLGGVLLFSVDQPTGGPRNVESPEQLRGLVQALRGAARLPLIVAVDQEGGRVARLGPTHGFPATSSADALGRGDPAATRDAARSMAETLASVGITLNLAPVVDLAVNPDNPIIAGVQRSFGADPDIVVAHARAFVEAHHAAGVACAIKHFPGQGSAAADTHLGIVDVTADWTRDELRPFAELVAAGTADAVLTAHIYNAALDADHPATLSRATIGGMLRDELGFDGPVISDDLQMGAIRDAYGFAEAVALSIEAGVDLLLIANQLTYEPDVVARTIDIIERLVRDGRIAEDRIDEAVARVARLRPID